MDMKKQENSVVELVKEKTVSLTKTFYISLCWLVVACLSSISLEIGARSPLGYSVTKSAAFNKIFRRNYNMKIYMEMGSLFASLLSAGLIIMARQTKNPYLYIPWLINSMSGMLFNEAPAFFNFIKTQMPYAPFPALIFAFTTIVLFVEQLCIWGDAFKSFMVTWKEYLHRNENHIEVELKNIIENNNVEVEVGKKNEDELLHHDSEDEYKISNFQKRAKSLTNVIKYVKKNS